MNKARLEKVIEAVEAVPDEAFDMSCWEDAGLCGTVCCAVGTYCHANPDCGLQIFDGEPVMNGHDDWDAVEVHFDLKSSEARFLFGGWNYPSRRPDRAAVISRIRDFIDSQGKIMEEVRLP